MLNIAHHSGASAGGVCTHVLVLTAHFSPSDCLQHLHTHEILATIVVKKRRYEIKVQG